MSSPSYLVPGLTLSLSATFSTPTQDLQKDLRALGYIAGPIDGIFGKNSHSCVMALQYDLMNNTGASSRNDGNSPAAVQSYNNGSVTAVTGIVDQGLAACIAAMVSDVNCPKVPSSSNPVADNQRALAAAQNAATAKVPLPFLLQILSQESDQKQFEVPSASNLDNFVTIGLDHNNAASPAAITSRGYGIGQATLFHHPPTSDEVAGVISDPLLKVAGAVTKFRNNQYHKGTYTNVPMRANILCDWPYAIRRYNGSGVNSYDYQAEVLWRIIR